METVICPICKKQLRDETLSASESAESLPGETLYCPSCEMLVEPVVSSGRVGADASDSIGRTRCGGSNAGGSQRGDLSDEGASQWRKDPKEGERNSWQCKD